MNAAPADPARIEADETITEISADHDDIANDDVADDEERDTGAAGDRAAGALDDDERPPDPATSRAARDPDSHRDDIRVDTDDTRIATDIATDDTRIATDTGIATDDATVGSLSLEDASVAAHVTWIHDEEARAIDAAGGFDEASMPGEAAPGAIDEASALTSATVGVAESREAHARDVRTWLLGRVDLGIAWRRRWSAPMHAPAHRDDQIWLIATWRR